MASTPRPEHASNEASLPVLKETKAASSYTPSSVAGTKRPAPSLLPPFEPFSSSPALPRPLKRQNTGPGTNQQQPQISSVVVNGTLRQEHARLKYPTPVPTSSTGIMSSSPSQQLHHRPSLRRTASERAPFAVVPGVVLSENGETLMMGRSSNSSHYQLSNNRLISRVHVKARYIAATEQPSSGDAVNKVEIVCNGWNGLRLHCQGRSWDLFKGDSFTSETEGAEMLVDVEEARIMIQWPTKSSDALSALSDSNWDDSPTHGGHALQSSPPRRTARLQSPESPTPATNLASSQRLQALLPDGEDPEESIQIYEDAPELPKIKVEGTVDVNASIKTEVTASFSSDLSEPDDDDPDENDPDEENDPIVHSFGPFGANIEGRLASISTNSPRALKPPKRLDHMSSNETLSPHNAIHSASSKSPTKDAKEAAPSMPHSSSPKIESFRKEPKEAPPQQPVAPKADSPPPDPVSPTIINHVINQLAFSRLSSTPLTTIFLQLPSESRQGLTKKALRHTMESTPAIGMIERQGKDAAGKPLESEYYYRAENDDDELRANTMMTGLRKPSLRECRKQHKQYYWKRPKTP